MKTIVCLFLSTLLAATASAAVTKTIEDTYPLTADGVLTLSNVNGSIEITAWDRTEVSLVAELRAKSQEDLDRISVIIDAQPTRLAIETKYQKSSSWFGGNNSNGEVRYTLKVPAGIKIEKLNTVNSSVTLSGVTGQVDVDTVNGRITATGLAADASLNTVNGSIEATFTAVGATASIHLETVNGSCELALPADVNADLRASTVNGRVHSALPVTIEKSKRNSLRGTLGSGGATISLSSVNGSIDVRGS